MRQTDKTHYSLNVVSLNLSSCTHQDFLMIRNCKKDASCMKVHISRKNVSKKTTLCEEDSNKKINTRFLTQVVSKKLG